MGQKYIIKQSKNGLVQIALEKYDDLSAEDIVKAANSLGVDLSTIDQKELVEGAISEAKEHPKVITDIGKAVQVAYDHLKEIPNYYSKLKEFETEKMIKGGPGSGRHPEGYNPLRRDAKFGDEIVFNTGGETLRGTIVGKNEKGELKVVTNSGTIHFRNRNELGMPQGGYKQKGE